MKKGIILILTLLILGGAHINAQTRLKLTIINIIDAVLVVQYYVGYDLELNCGGN